MLQRDYEALLGRLLEREGEFRGFYVSKVSTKAIGPVIYWTMALEKVVPFVAAGYARITRGIPVYLDGKFVLADVYTYSRGLAECEYILVRVYGSWRPIETGLEAYVESVFSRYFNAYEGRARKLSLRRKRNSVVYVFKSGEELEIEIEELEKLRKELEHELGRRLLCIF